MNLAFFSGNEVFWKTRWEKTTHRTLVSYKETHENAHVDPPGQWTGTLARPARSTPTGARPENALTGSSSRSTRAPAHPGPGRLPQHALLAPTRRRGRRTLPDGTLGYEWDSDKNNGFRPPRAGGPLRDHGHRDDRGARQVLTDNGSTYDSLGTASHSLTLYRAPSGALVFGAGTVQWAWGLDPAHDRDPSRRAGHAAGDPQPLGRHARTAAPARATWSQLAVGNPLAPMP